MEHKKNPKIALEPKKGMFFNIGLATSLFLVIVAFEWRSYDDSGLADLGTLNDDFEDLMEIPLTEQPPPPPPKVELPVIVEIPDEEEIEEEIEVELDVEIDEETVIEEVIFEEEEEVADEIFTIVEEQPGPVGGMSAFYKYVSKNMKYPSSAKRMGVEGRVYVQFVVDKDGNITDVRAVKGIGSGCDEAAVKLLKGAPKWTPGKQRGRPVRVQMILPITFKLS